MMCRRPNSTSESGIYRFDAIRKSHAETSQSKGEDTQPYNLSLRISV